MKRSKRRPICLCLLLVYFSLLIAGCGQSTHNTGNVNDIKSYKDIPDVTEEEIDAIEALKKTRTNFTYAHSLETESYMLPDGTFTGFHYSFCALLTELFGIDFNGLFYEEWEDLIGGFNLMESDFTGTLTASPERMLKYHMTRPITDRTLGVYTHIDSDKLRTEMDIDGLTIAFMRNTITSNLIKNAYPVSFVIVETDEYSEVAEMLQNGEIDAFITASAVDPNFLEYSFIQSKVMFPLAYTSASMSTANPELEPIISVVDKYLAAGGIDKLVELYKEDIFQYTKYKLTRSLTDEERAYIANSAANNLKVKAALEYDNYPISFYNNKDEQFQGIAIDILNEVSRLTGIEFASATSRDTTWGDVLKKVQSGEISMVTQMFYTESRINDYIWSKEPYDYTRYAFLSKTEHPDFTRTQIARLKVGALGSSMYTTMYNLWFPNLDNLSTYETLDDGFEALEKNEIDLLMTAENMLLSLTNYREKSGYKVNMSFDSPIESRFAFSNKDTVLCSILDKAQRYVNVNAISSKWTSRVFDYERKVADERANSMMVFAAILSAMLLMVVWLLISISKNNKQRMLAEAKALSASQYKSVFLAHMSHEIRTPLSAIIGMSEIAKNSINNPGKALTSINQVITSSHHLLGVLNDVLDMSKIESGKLELMNESFRLLDACREVSDIIAQRCLEKHIRFISNVTELQDVILVGDKLRVNQVLINLLGNAVKFTKDGGEVRFNVRVISEDDTQILLGFLVSDNGVGISEQQLSRLFMPFEQGSNSITAQYGGTGLGLSISQNLVNRMGGTIEVESKLDVGTDFTFSLRFAKGEGDMNTASEPQDMPALNGKRILLVEDIDINRTIVCELLSPTGAIIEEAADGQKAVEMYEKSPIGYYNLIFMDIQMPVLDGYASAKKIRALEREDAKDVPIIAMTANAYKEDVDQCLAAGMNDHTSKPIDLDRLIQKMRIWLKPRS